MKKVSLLIPAYNEEKVLVMLYQRIKAIIDSINQYDWDILFVNDGSNDNTLAVLYSLRAQDERINILDLSRNYGKEVAMLAGFDYVEGDGVIIL
ncbi:MAG: glycosyltransferase, partial [Bacteroidales bacterium]